MEKNLTQKASSVLKIVLYGPESTGKTTLAQELANHYQTTWAPEFAREYLIKKSAEGQVCGPADMLPIAYGQIQAENSALSKANRFLFCDTNVLVTKVFSEINYSYCDPALDVAARNHHYDLFLLTDVDIPWKNDGLRNRSTQRCSDFEQFKNELIKNKRPFLVLCGNAEERLEKAKNITSEFEKAIQMGFGSEDFVQIFERGLPMNLLMGQLYFLKEGVPSTQLARPATLHDGILEFSDQDYENYARFFDECKDTLSLMKFVPASGAATRMFKFLNEFLQNFDPARETINNYINRHQAKELRLFIVGMEKLPFYSKVLSAVKLQNPGFRTWTSDQQLYELINTMITHPRFNFAHKPKGVLDFHAYMDHNATPVEEHLNESALYATANGKSQLHFTVSEHHLELFAKIVEEQKPRIEEEAGISIEVHFSFQDTATDSIALDMENRPFRTDEGKLLFRPGGHGALIHNLNALSADIIFIKNIDNVQQKYISGIGLYKKALAGKLIMLQRQVFSFLNDLENKNVDEKGIKKMIDFARTHLNIALYEDVHKYTLENKIDYLMDRLNRPIRICGMVKNEGEPGGGPFWVVSNRGNLSLQIVESSQVDTNIKPQKKILKSSTHFNPVDLVCGVRNYKGEKFDLLQYVNPQRGFVVHKTHGGRDLKSFELPGLWNGAMSKWITVFAEIPLSTFNPVKTVNDLMKPAHQPE